VAKRSLEAQAYVNTAIMKFQKRQTKRHMQKWFGGSTYDDPASRKKVQKTLNSVSNMLGNVEYVYPGPECESNTYAYVYPRGSKAKDSQGRFVFYLCPYYMKVPASEQIETLVHEGSHHATSYLDDVQFRGQTAYGRSTCQQLARSDSDKALDNADSFCYYIQDITDKGV